MIIPLSRKKIEIGDIVISIKEINKPYFIISPGHEFEVVDKNGYGYILKDLEKGIIIENCREEIVYKKSLEDAKNEYETKRDTDNCLEFIKENCPNKSYSFDHYDKYDSCKLCGYNNYCKPKFECAKHISSEKLKESKLLIKYLREIKLKQIQKS